MLLRKGNTKLGKAVWQFSLPARTTCPGASGGCDVCYAERGHFRRPSVKAFLAANLAASKKASFVHRLIGEVHAKKPAVVRIHVAGDFYSTAYVAKWHTVTAVCPDVTFYAYTRSWRVPELLPPLKDLALLDNARLWFSADSDTGQPPEAKRVRVAWLLRHEGETPGRADLIFRDSPLRKTPSKRVGLTLVCPHEQSLASSSTTCTRCEVCFR